ncbi:MAG: phosphoglycerate dehydrogenase [Acidobacteria bacterium]|nr:phosphoglycerate dehydrogenase [Acidobacteriota bacterium]
MKVLIAEPLAEAAVAQFQAVAGWNIVVSNPKEYDQHLGDCDALVVRSAVKVNKAVLDKAPKLRVIGRAGVGVDNVDMEAATAAGVLVMNTPGGNAVSVAEHTLGFMLSLARMIPEASASTRSGKWEKKKFLGNELRGKTLGVVGLGNIGREVVQRAKAFEMTIVGADPFVSSQLAAGMGVELVDLDTLYSRSDYVSLHVGVTAETKGMINPPSIAKMKDGVRIINCARGELIDQAALVAGLTSGKVAGAGLDVFDPEPPKEGDPILSAPNLLATPHIGGSTEEAQEIVGIRIAKQMVDYLTQGVAVAAVNMPAMSPDQFRAVGPWLDVAERLGTFASYIADGNPRTMRLTYRGKIAEMNTQLIRNAALAGMLNRSLQQRANIVNSMPIASSRGLGVEERHEKRVVYVDSIRVELETDAGVTTVEGSLVLDKVRLLQVDGIPCEAALAGHLLYLKNRDVPGVIGHVGGVLGSSGINIANFSLGRQEVGVPGLDPIGAVAILETDVVVSPEQLEKLKEHKAVLVARTVELPR